MDQKPNPKRQPKTTAPPPCWYEVLHGTFDGVFPSERNIEDMLDRIEGKS
ncbi:MAG: hypothetical protein AAF245_03970 [Pseudomonadota bacterium]